MRCLLSMQDSRRHAFWLDDGWRPAVYNNNARRWCRNPRRSPYYRTAFEPDCLLRLALIPNSLATRGPCLFGLSVRYLCECTRDCVILHDVLAGSHTFARNVVSAVLLSYNLFEALVPTSAFVLSV